MKKRAHFIGIAGMGMSAAAILLKEQGWDVGGTDAEAYPPATTQLKRHGIPFNTSYGAANIPKDAELIVIGKNTKLTRENPEVRAAYNSGKRVVPFAKILGETIQERHTIVVAGSYGKSTITSLIAWCLSRSGVDAGWFIGGAPQEMEPSHLGTNPVFVIEGDEYPIAHGDARPKFSLYGAHDAIVTAATHDHVNIYKTDRDFYAVFHTFVRALPKDGLLILCADEPLAASLSSKTKARVVYYGLDANAEWHVASVSRREITAFDLMRGKEKIARLSTTLLGDHNIQNTIGASAMLLEKKLITPEQLAAAIKDFKGLARRLDKKTTRSSVPAYEGFGSSREKLRAAIEALAAQYPSKRLVVVFEPHTFSWRNRAMLHWFDTAFEGASQVVLYKPYEQGADMHEQSTQEEMAERLAAVGVDVHSFSNPHDVMNALPNLVKRNDVVLLSSSGAMDGLIESIPQWLGTAFS